MSASLVGSEMCIRDRVWPPGAAAATCVNCSLWPHPERQSAEGSRRSWKTVSYTHLTLPTICSV
eukprot:1752346-Alexandrium_andersonii.AAC.1